jgi:hypothetical protein
MNEQEPCYSYNVYLRMRRNVMPKLIIAAAATIALVGSPLAVAAAADGQDAHHHRAWHHVGTSAGGPSDRYVFANPAIRDGYIMNGAFDWRRLRPGQKMPWYARGYSSDCVAWTPNAYHYACDPNNRY